MAQAAPDLHSTHRDTEISVSSTVTSNGPADGMGRTVRLPSASVGIRPEYPHTEPQPYSNLPERTRLPVTSVISNFGAGGRPAGE